MIDYTPRPRRRTSVGRRNSMPKTLIRHEDAPRFTHEGTEVRGYASPSRGSASISAWRLALAPGAESPVHELTRDEAFLALAGVATVELAGETFELRAGDGLSVPPGTAFRIRNRGDAPFEAVACMAAEGQACVEGV